MVCSDLLPFRYPDLYKCTITGLKLLDDYDSDEAWIYANHKRKYLFDKILKKYEPPEGTQPLSIKQEGRGGVLQNEAEGPVQRVERWVESELEMKMNQPK